MFAFNIEDIQTTDATVVFRFHDGGTLEIYPKTGAAIATDATGQLVHFVLSPDRA